MISAKARMKSLSRPAKFKRPGERVRIRSCVGKKKNPNKPALSGRVSVWARVKQMDVTPVPLPNRSWVIPQNPELSQENKTSTNH